MVTAAFRRRGSSLSRRCITSLAEQVCTDCHPLWIIEAQHQDGGTPDGGERLDRRSVQTKVCGPPRSAGIEEGCQHAGCGIKRGDVRSLAAIALEAGVGQVL